MSLRSVSFSLIGTIIFALNLRLPLHFVLSFLCVTGVKILGMNVLMGWVVSLSVAWVDLLWGFKTSIHISSISSIKLFEFSLLIG